MSSNIQSVKELLKSWIQTKVRIDSFDLDVPEELYSNASTENLSKPANTGTVFPVENLSYSRTQFNSLEGTGTFPFSIIFRYPREFSYHQLPISKLESLVEYIQGSALVEGICSDSISSVEPESTKNSVGVKRDGTDQDDWLVNCTFLLTVQFKVTLLELAPEYEPNDPDTTPVDSPINLGIKVYKSPSPVDPSNSTLDTELNFTNINNYG
ncbi:MAG: hypothetical protein KME13_18495 [Myxacorys californica WJT36-NPBG1]|jgi:hypothetical protein|nr:hypothetical protein [Myxacorys californica WJT36-NPBG1]